VTFIRVHGNAHPGRLALQLASATVRSAIGIDIVDGFDAQLRLLRRSVPRLVGVVDRSESLLGDLAVPVLEESLVRIGHGLGLVVGGEAVMSRRLLRPDIIRIIASGPVANDVLRPPSRR
jgi:hypothetical protein